MLLTPVNSSCFIPGSLLNLLFWHIRRHVLMTYIFLPQLVNVLSPCMPCLMPELQKTRVTASRKPQHTAHASLTSVCEWRESNGRAPLVPDPFPLRQPVVLLQAAPVCTPRTSDGIWIRFIIRSRSHDRRWTKRREHECPRGSDTVLLPADNSCWQLISHWFRVTHHCSVQRSCQHPTALPRLWMLQHAGKLTVNIQPLLTVLHFSRAWYTDLQHEPLFLVSGTTLTSNMNHFRS